MALRQLLLTKRISALTAQLDELKAKDADFQERSAALSKREADLEAAVNELPDDAPEEDRKAIDELADEFEADQTALETEQGDHEAEKQRLADEIQKLTDELEELNKKAAEPPKPAEPKEERKGEKVNMETRTKFFGMNKEERDSFFARDDVKGFIGEIRSIKTRGITNGSVIIPDIMLEVLRDNMEKYSKLLPYVTVKKVNGTSRQSIVGAVPEGVWMEATGALNELDMEFNQIELDGYMVGGIIWVHNTLLEDSDIALGSEIMSQLGQAIGKGLDRAILFGTGTKMPVGIATRLAQSSVPNNWGAYAPTWTNLSTTNVKKLNIDGTTGSTFYASLIDALGVAKPNYSDGRCFWAMNRKTHIKLMTKALAFDAAAALVAGVHNQMPIVGGDIVEIEALADNNIIGGYGSVYLLAERAGAKVESSEHAKFQQMMTGFRGYARYDGMPVFGEAFVQVSFANADATTSSTFPTDYANADLGELTVGSAAGTSAGDTKITVSGQELSGTTLLYKTGIKTAKVYRGMKMTDAWNDFGDSPNFTTGVNLEDLTAGHVITVVEFDAAGKAIKAGIATIVVKTGA